LCETGSLNESEEEGLSGDASRGAESVGIGGLNESGRVGGEGSERESECWGRRESERYQLEEET
jgi:hypothetical protein